MLLYIFVNDYSRFVISTLITNFTAKGPVNIRSEELTVTLLYLETILISIAPKGQGKNILI